MKTKNIFISFISIILIGLFLLFVILVTLSLNQPKPSEIYADNIHSIAELKARSDEVGESYGTAVLINDNGDFVTNAHVVTYSQLGAINTYDKYEIRFADDEEYAEVELVRHNTEVDIAILKIKNEAVTLHPISISQDYTLNSGDTVYAVGNSLNHGIAITQGIVSCPLVRFEYLGKIREAIQCDLTITEGNSGGALLNKNGDLIALTTFRIRDENGAVVYGMAYCIPIATVLDFVSSTN